MDEKVNVSLLAYNVNILYEGVEIIFIYENENKNLKRLSPDKMSWNFYMRKIVI